MTSTTLFNLGGYDISYDSKYDRIKFKFFESWIPFSTHNFMIFLFSLTFKFAESSDEMSFTLRQFPSSLEVCRVQGNYVLFYISPSHQTKLILPATSVKILTSSTLMSNVTSFQKGSSLLLAGEYKDISSDSYF